jgi:flagellar basal-body rod protein FlgF
MIRGLYSAASALDAASLNQELVADNLANVNTPGFRRHGLLFETVQQDVENDQQGSANSVQGMKPAGFYTNFEGGPLQHTGNPLDLASSSNVFFVLNGPNGPLYTHNGTFERNAQGLLQSHSGLPVRSPGGAITIPPGATNITVNPDGTVLADNAQVGRLQLAEFPDPSVLQRAGTTLFEGPGGRQPNPGTYQIQQGYREGSNVQIVNEMVSMLMGMRHYEAAQKALSALGDALAQNTRPQS